MWKCQSAASLCECREHNWIADAQIFTDKYGNGQYNITVAFLSVSTNPVLLPHHETGLNLLVPFVVVEKMGKVSSYLRKGRDSGI